MPVLSEPNLGKWLLAGVKRLSSSDSGYFILGGSMVAVAISFKKKKSLPGRRLAARSPL